MSDNPIEKPKKIRSDKQKEAFDKARKVRADNLAKKKLEKEEASKKIAEESMNLIKKNQDQEPQEPQEIIPQKSKKPTNDFPKSSTGINPMETVNKKNKNIEVEVIPPPSKKTQKKN